MKEILMKSEEQKSRTEVASFLKDVAEKIESGTIKLIQGEETIVLEIPENLTLELKVQEKTKEKKSKKKQLEIELEWYIGEKSEQIELG